MHWKFDVVKISCHNGVSTERVAPIRDGKFTRSFSRVSRKLLLITSSSPMKGLILLRKDLLYERNIYSQDACIFCEYCRDDSNKRKCNSTVLYN